MIKKENIKLIDIECIQEFLPEGHVDKINTKKDLLTEEKEKYPIGTKFKPIYGKYKEATIQLNDFKKSHDGIQVTSNYGNNESCPFTIYSKKEGWAQIVKEETELDKWLKETKVKNLSLEQLTNYIYSTLTCSFSKVYKKLKGDSAKSKAQILWNEWNEFWYLEWEDWLTEDLWNELVIKLNNLYGKQTKYLHWMTFEHFRNNKFIRSKVGLRDDDHWCIDNNNQGLKIKKHLSDFITKPIENVTIKLPVNNIDFREYKIYPEIPSNCFDVEKLNLQEKALTKPQLIQIKQLQTLN